MSFRNGQWVTTATKIEGCHCTPDGRCVGIYVRASTDTFGNSVPEHVSFQRPEPVRDEHGVIHHNLGVYLPPEQLKDLQPLADKAHIPAGRAPFTALVPEMAQG
jgi:hypothetical protein